MNYNEVLEVVGCIEFDGYVIDVYGDLNYPLFRLQDIAKLVGYSEGNSLHLLAFCEDDEFLTVQIVRSGQRRSVKVVTESGLYNILSQSRTISARKWRRVINNELIKLREEAGRNISEQFDIWSDAASNIYFDDRTGELMESYILPGGDVGQRPYKV